MGTQRAFKAVLKWPQLEALEIKHLTRKLTRLKNSHSSTKNRQGCNADHSNKGISGFPLEMLADEPHMAACCNSCQHINERLLRYYSYFTVHCLHIHQGPILQFCTQCLILVLLITGPCKVKLPLVSLAVPPNSALTH